MTKEEGKAIAGAINGALGIALEKLVKGQAPDPKFNPADPEWQKKNGVPQATLDNLPSARYGKSDPLRDEEEQYQRFKRRLIEECRVDPILLTLLTTSNAIEVQVEPRQESITASTLRGRVARLMASGFFKETRATFAVRKELSRTGADPGGGGALAGHLSTFVADGFLVRDGDGFQMAPGIKVTETTLEAR